MAMERQRSGSGVHQVARTRSGATPRTLDRPSSSSVVETLASAQRSGREAGDFHPSAHGPPAGGSWQFMTQRGTWQQHSVAACRQLERAFQTSKPTCSISTPAGRIEVDLNSMTQHLSHGTGSNVKRRIRRLGQDAPEGGTTPAGAPRASSSPRLPSPGTEAATFAARSSTPADTPRDSSPPRLPPPGTEGAAFRARRSSRPTPKAAPSTARPTVARSSSQSSVARTPAVAKSPPLRRTPPTTTSRRAPTRSTPARRETPDDEDIALAIALSMSEQGGNSLTGDGRLTSPLAAAGESIIVFNGRSHTGGSRGNNTRCDRDEELALLLARQEEALGLQLHEARNRRGGDPHYSGDVLDVDRMGYEELLALSERIGNVDRPSRPTQLDVGRLPTRRVTDASNEEDECAICCDCYNEGDELRILPCLHAFHTRCIDAWLLSNAAGAKLCPVCNSEIGI
mmetsp:Transcript_125603/g.250608  ORF Transcript_125603/g.250608 Transcript_125603/m.250608 type:complete len:455 (-) Transcript_125603:65-1429(-)